MIFEGKNVVLVGPATTLKGSGLGKEIDSFDIVCRLNHHLPGPELEKDYGSRNDVVFSGPVLLFYGYEIFKEVRPPSTIIFPAKNVYDHDHYGKMIQQIHDDHPDIECLWIGDEFATTVEKELGTSPTTGILAICYLLSLPIKSLFVTGLDFYPNCSP